MDQSKKIIDTFLMSDETNYIQHFFEFIEKLEIDLDKEVSLSIENKTVSDFIKKIYPKITFTECAENIVCLSHHKESPFHFHNYLNLGLSKEGVLINPVQKQSKPPFFINNHSEYYICYSNKEKDISSFLKLIKESIKSEVILYVPDPDLIKTILKIGKEFDIIEFCYSRTDIKNIKNSFKENPKTLRVYRISQNTDENFWTSFIQFSSNYIFIDPDYTEDGEQTFIDTLDNFRDKYVCSSHLFEDLEDYTRHEKVNDINCYQYDKPLPDASKSEEFTNKIKFLIKLAIVLKENKKIFDIILSKDKFSSKLEQLNEINT